MKVVVDNLGPVRHAEIDLGKKLIVFAGANNSGKTYVAWTLYGLLADPLSRIEPEDPAIPPPAREFAEALLTSGAEGIDPKDVRGCLLVLANYEGARLAKSLYRLFAASQGSFDGATISVEAASRDSHALRGHVALEVSLPRDGRGSLLYERPGSGFRSTLETFVAETDHAVGSPEFRASLTPVSARDLTASQQATVLRIVAEWVRDAAEDFIQHHEVAIFPAERTAVSLFAAELAQNRTALVDELLDERLYGKSAAETLARKARRYPIPISHAVMEANDLARRSREVGPLAELADELEAVLGGRMTVSEHGELHFTHMASGAPQVPFHIASSMVKSLASLVFYLRHQATTRSTIVIDEPELNLHPDLQRKVARLLAKVANRGVQVIMSTHSDYILREVSNLVRLGEGGERGQELAKELDYDTASLLNAEDVGVWHFHAGAADALPVDVHGFNVPSVDEAIEAQNAATLAIELGLDPDTPESDGEA